MIELTVYVDVLLAVNLYVNYILLLCTSKLVHQSLNRIRILLSAVMGSAYTLIIFIDKMPVIIGLLSKIIVCTAMVLCGFGFVNLRRFLRFLFAFCAVNFSFAGILYLLWTAVAPVGMYFNNGVAYFDINLKILAFSTVICFGIVSLINYFISRKAPPNCIYSVTVFNKGNKAELTALCDTGNSLRESFSSFPVLIGEYSALKNVVPQCVADYLNGNENVSGSEMRLVIHNTVSSSGIMPSFRPDKIIIRSLSKNCTVKNVYIAVTDRNIGNGEYQIILNPAVLEECNKNEKIIIQN